jgi:multidrug efflux pump subunit AcrB
VQPPTPASRAIGNATVFDFELLDRANQGHEKLMEVRDQLLSVAGKDPRLSAVRANGLDDEPQYQFNVDWERASALGLTITDINNTVSAAWGSQHVNDFVDRGYKALGGGWQENDSRAALGLDNPLL